MELRFGPVSSYVQFFGSVHIYMNIYIVYVYIHIRRIEEKRVYNNITLTLVALLLGGYYIYYLK